MPLAHLSRFPTRGDLLLFSFSSVHFPALIHHAHGFRADQYPATSSDQTTSSSPSTAGEQQPDTKPHPLSDVPLTEEVKSRLRSLNPVTFGLPNPTLADAPLKDAVATKDEVDMQLRVLNPLSYGVDEEEVFDDSITSADGMKAGLMRAKI